MNINPHFFVCLILSWCVDMTNGFCDKFPFGHICRNLDLTGFCLQVAHLLKIEEKESQAPPYIEQFDKIFQKLRNEVHADSPFVHFGGYKGMENDYPNCKFKRCTPVIPPPPGTAPPPAGANDCPPGPPPMYPGGCPLGTFANPVAPRAPGTKGCKEDDCRCCFEPPDDTMASGTIFSLQDGCELKYLKAPIIGGGAVLNPIKKDEKAKENPYRLDITEITVGGDHLHNWLHIKIYADASVSPDMKYKDLGKGKIKMAFIMAADAEGHPVGEFVNSIPCGADCQCIGESDPTKPSCHQGTIEDTIPCMFDGNRVTANTGMMMVYSKFDGPDEGLSEIHASWRFSQSASPDSFITEIHFRALLVDEFEPLEMEAKDSVSGNMRLSAISERRIKKKGMFGWNPLYTILHPTIETVGGWDYFREDVYSQDDVKCHIPIDVKRYTEEPYPNSGETIKQIMETPEREHCYRLDDTFISDEDKKTTPEENVQYCFSGTGNEKRFPVRCPGTRSKVEPWFHDTYGYTRDGRVDTSQVYPWTLYGTRIESYVLRDGGLIFDKWEAYHHWDDKTPDAPTPKLYFGTEHKDIKLEYFECVTTDPENYYGQAHQYAYPELSDGYDIQGKYGHFCRIDGDGRRVLNLPEPISGWPNTLAELWKLPPITANSFMDDRCYCPRIPPTPDPRYKEPPEIQVQGRRQHAYQMIIGWNCIVPFGIFVSRYYKETYSKVFFLQEYWWYTIHVLCMVSAAMFTFGGIYVMELKRRDPVNWFDGNITWHVTMGYFVITIFFIQVVSGFFRLKDPKKRLCQIFTHWLLGVLEYLLAIVCMINASFILLSGMTCEGVVALGFLLVFQAMFYASMEVHMRNVDKLLKLQPPRSYLPPPIMRVFHKDAPDSKFRIHVLIAYFILCVVTSVIQYVSMESNTLGESCFIKSKKYIQPTIETF